MKTNILDPHLASSDAAQAAQPCVGQHTPGPWVVESVEADNGMGNDLFIIPKGDSENWIARMAGHGPSKENADLIACAPELLCALQDLLAWANLDHSTHPKTIVLRDQCKLAIRNAKGAR